MKHLWPEERGGWSSSVSHLLTPRSWCQPTLLTGCWNSQTQASSLRGRSGWVSIPLPCCQIIWRKWGRLFNYKTVFSKWYNTTPILGNVSKVWMMEALIMHCIALTFTKWQIKCDALNKTCHKQRKRRITMGLSDVTFRLTKREMKLLKLSPWCFQFSVLMQPNSLLPNDMNGQLFNWSMINDYIYIFLLLWFLQIHRTKKCRNLLQIVI